jgi:invasion protein IalB
VTAKGAFGRLFTPFAFGRSPVFSLARLLNRMPARRVPRFLPQYGIHTMSNLSRTVIWLALALVTLVVGVWIGRASAPHAPGVPTISFYQDWRLSCPSSAQKGGNCTLSENLIDTGTHVQVAQLTMAQTSKGRVLVITTPFDVLLGSGVGVALGTDKPKAYPYLTCTSAGCVAEVPIDNALYDSFRQEASGRLYVAGLNNQTAAMTFSLKGFKDADDAATAFRKGHRFLGLDI